MSSLDHGVLNLPLSKRGSGSLDAQIDRHLAAERRERRREARAMAQERRAARVAEAAARPKFTAEDLAGAVIVRDRHGWHRVVQVNAKTVTVTTGHSWNDRVPFDQILEVRS